MSILGGGSGSGGGSNINLNNTQEKIGFGSTGMGTQLTSGAANTFGSPFDLGTTANDWVGFHLHAAMPNSSSIRYFLELSFDGATTWADPIFFQPSTSGGLSHYLPLKVAAGSDIKARVACSTLSSNLNVAITGIVKNANSPPGFSSMKLLDASGVSTCFPSTTDITVSIDSGVTWATVIASTADEYDYWLVIPGPSSSSPANAQAASVVLGVGATPAEFYRFMIGIAAASTPTLREQGYFAHSVTAANKISIAVSAGAVGDKLRAAVYGFKA